MTSDDKDLQNTSQFEDTSTVTPQWEEMTVESRRLRNRVEVLQKQRAAEINRSIENDLLFIELSSREMKDEACQVDAVVRICTLQ